MKKTELNPRQKMRLEQEKITQTLIDRFYYLNQNVSHQSGENLSETIKSMLYIAEFLGC